MAKLVRPKQIDPSLINGYVLTTSGSTVLWAPNVGSTTGNCQSNFYVENIWGCDTDGVTLNNANYIDFLILTGNPTHQEGRLHWQDNTKTIQIDTEQTDVHIELGHQNMVRVVNNTGSVLSKGRIVYIIGGSGGRPEVSLADYTTDPTSARSLGFVVEPIPSTPNSIGYVVTYGVLRGTLSSPLDTSSYSAGTQLYLYTGGTFTNVKPVAPLHEVRMAQVVRSNVNEGVIFVTVQNGYELNELHDVYYTTPNDGDILRWVSANTRWEVFPTSSLGFVSGTGTTNYGAMFTPNGNTVGIAPIKFADTVTKGLPINTTTDSIGIGYDIVMTGGSNNFFVGYELFSHTSTINSGILGNRFYIDPNTTINAFYGLGNYNFINPSSNLLGIYMMGDSNSYNNICQFSTTLGESNTFTDIGYLFLGGIGNNMNNVSGMHVIGDYNNTGGNLVDSSNILGSSNYLDNSSTISIVGTSNFATNISNATILGNYNLSPLSNEVTIGFNDTGARLTSTGDMSIGLATPTSVSAKLEVKGNGTTPATYALKIDNNSASPLVHVRDDGYVGIGTTTPTEKLEIYDSSAPTALKTFINNSLSSGYAELMMQTDISDMRFGTGGSASTPYGGSAGDCYFGAVSYSNLILATNNTVRMNIRNTGEVGINTGNASLTSQLEVVGPGSTSTTYGLKVFNSSYSTPTLQVRDDNVVEINGGGGLGSDFSVHQRGFASVNVFDVYNNDSSVLLAYMNSSAPNTGEVRFAGNGLNIDVASKNVELGFYSGVYNRKLNVRAGTPTEEIVSFHAYNATGGHYFAVNSNHPAYFMQNSAYTTTVLFHSAGDSYINGGNVGVGTTSPSATLDLVGTFQYVDGNQASGYVLTSDANGNATWQSTSGFTGSGGQFTGNTSASCITDLYVTNIYGCSPLHIEPSGVNDVYIVENGGNAGIGTSTPTAKLHINGPGSTSATYGLKIQNSSLSTILYVRDDQRIGFGADANANAKFYFENSTGTNTVPALKVYHNPNFTFTAVELSSVAANLRFNTDNNSWDIGTSNDYPLYLSQNGIRHYAASTTAGNQFIKMGVTNQPNATVTAKLKIISHNDDVLNLWSPNTANTNLYFSRSDGPGTERPAAKIMSLGAGSGVGSTGQLQLFGYNLGYNLGLTVESNGDVGIGTSAPNTKLDVNGDIAHRSSTPSSFSTQQDNFPTSGTSFLRLENIDALPQDITGFADGYDGKRLVVTNIGITSIVLKNQDVNSLAANRMEIYNYNVGGGLADWTLGQGDAVEFIYNNNVWTKIN